MGEGCGRKVSVESAWRTEVMMTKESQKEHNTIPLCRMRKSELTAPRPKKVF